MSVVREPERQQVGGQGSVAPQVAGPNPAAAEDVDTRGLHVAECAAWSLVWLAVLTAGVDVWGFWWSSPVTVALAPLMVLAGLAGLVATWVARSPRLPWLQRSALGAVLVSILMPQAVILHTRTFYSTDSAAFDHVAAGALLHGHNPYTASMAPAARLLSVPARYWTYTVSGGHVAHVSYPAGSFLVDAAAMALGFHHVVVDWVDLFAWVACAVLFFVLLPVSLRWLSALLALTPIFVGMFTSGGTDAVFLPLLVLAVWRWDRFAVPGERSMARWLGPVALGLACAVKQTPWFCLAPLALGVAFEARLHGRRAWRVAERYVATTAAVFGVVNLPFVLWQPGAWSRGTLLPFFGGLVADGQGLVSLATHGVTGGADLTVLSLAGALTYLALLGALATWYAPLKRVWMLLLPVAFFVSPRSLSSYLVDLFPVAVVAAVSVHGVGPGHSEAGAWRRRSALLVGLPGLLAAVAAVVALSSHPLTLRVDAVAVTHGGRQVQAVTVTVVNDTAQVEVPHFLVNTGAGTAGFWGVAGGGSMTLGPHRSATVTLLSPVRTTAPQHGARWLVEAYVSHPDALSTSAMEVWAGR